MTETITVIGLIISFICLIGIIYIVGANENYIDRYKLLAYLDDYVDFNTTEEVQEAINITNNYFDIIVKDSNSLDCIDCLDDSQISDIYLFNSGDTATGNYSFDSGTLFIDSSDNRIGVGTEYPLSVLHSYYSDSGTNDVIEINRVERISSGTTERYFGIENPVYLKLNGNQTKVSEMEVGIWKVTEGSEGAYTSFNGLVQGDFRECLYLGADGMPRFNRYMPIGTHNSPQASGYFVARKGIGTIQDGYGAKMLFGAENDSSNLMISGGISFFNNFTGRSSDFALIVKGGEADTWSETEVIRGLYNGNVGFGTSTPNSRIEAIGDINATGDLMYGGSLVSYSPLMLDDDICIKDHVTNEYVKCGSYNYSFVCKPNDYCQKKAVLLEDKRDNSKDYKDCHNETREIVNENEIIEAEIEVCTDVVISEGNVDYYYNKLNGVET